MITEFQNYRYCVNCDWLQFSVRLRDGESPELVCPEGFRLEILPGTNIFRNRAILWRCSDGAKVITMLWGPYSRVIDKAIMSVQVANMILYSGGVHWAFRLLQDVVDCEFNSMSRVDICCDFEVTKFEQMFIRRLWIGDYYVQRKSEGAVWWHAKDTTGGRNVHCLNWGSCSSEIKVKLYNKSRELGLDVSRGTSSEKPWISREWERAGFDVCRVWRLEFSMTGSGQLLWEGKRISLDDVASGDWLFRVFCSLYHSRFVCRVAGRGLVGHKNLDPRVSILVLPKGDERFEWIDTADEPTASSEQIATLRRLVGTLEMPAVRANNTLWDSVATSILRVCESKGLRGYFGRVYGMDVDDWLQQAANDTGEGRFEVIPDIRE